MLYTPASSLCGNPVLIGLVCAYTHIPHQSILFFKLKRCSFWDFSCKSLPLYFTEKNHPPEQHVYLRSRSVLLQRDVAFLRSISFEFTDDFFGELEDCTHIGWCTQSSSNLHTTSCDVVFFWWPSHQSPLQTSTSFHIYQHTHYV